MYKQARVRDCSEKPTGRNDRGLVTESPTLLGNALIKISGILFILQLCSFTL